MSYSTCPIATVDAPVDVVWTLLGDLARYDLWWEVQTVSITPEGPAQPGQRILAGTRALGRWWNVLSATVEAVAPEKHHIDYLTHLPLGITGHNHLTCQPLDSGQTRVTFG